MPCQPRRDARYGASTRSDATTLASSARSALVASGESVGSTTCRRSLTSRTRSQLAWVATLAVRGGCSGIQLLEWRRQEQLPEQSGQLRALSG